MTKILIGILSGWILAAFIGLIGLSLGAMPVATKGAPLPMERFIAKIALRAALRSHINDESPIPEYESNLVTGAKLYKTNCAVCHGLPQHQKSAIAAGLFPPPPQLFEHGVDDDPVGETFWKIKNGIRLTGMPGFESSCSSDDLWKVTLLLKSWNKLPEIVTKTLNED